MRLEKGLFIRPAITFGLIWLVFLGFVFGFVSLLTEIHYEKRIEQIESQLVTETKKLQNVQSDNPTLTEEELLEDKKDILSYIQQTTPSAIGIQSFTVVNDYVNIDLVMDDKSIQSLAYPYEEIEKNVPKLREKLLKMQDDKKETYEHKINKLEKEKAISEGKLKKLPLKLTK